MIFLGWDYKQILMFRKILLLLFFLSSIIFVTSVKAFEPFIKSQSNPLPFSNNFQNWNEAGQYQPSVIFDNGIYKMWYASYSGAQFKIIYADSTDGINWTRQNLLDVYPGFDNHDPAIIKTQNGYTLFFVGSTGGGSQNFKIYKIDSADGVNFDTNSRQLVLQPTGNLESNAVSSPFIVFQNGVYYLFYLCWGNQGFRICMATSTNGNQWQRCPNNPVISETSDGPSILEKDGKHYLFFQSSLGVRQADSSDNLSCNMTWSNFQTVLPEPIVGPSVLDNQNILYLYYSGFTQTGLKIHLATSDNQIAPTPTPTASLTPTPNPSPTPTPQKNKVVIIPGLMASWNKEAMLHNKEVSQDKWNLLAFIKEYNGLTQSLENLGYIKDEDFFIFAYDWRKTLDILANDLKQFLKNHNLASSQINLVGHSLGGLVARIYGQKHGKDSLNKIITAGSPHLGTANTYKLVEAGEIERQNSTLWLMQKLAFQINRKGFETNKETINSVMPVAKDLFPIYDFLIDKEGNNISIQSMKIKNTTLLGYSSGFSQLFSALTTLAGDKDKNTLSGHKVDKRTSLDILMGDYPDGRPIENRFDLGDGVIASKSALAGDDLISLPADHGEIIYKAQPIKIILDKLGIPYSPNQIVEGKPTKITPSLIFALLSPAEMQVDFNLQHYQEVDGLIFIENADAGNYILKVKGKIPGGKYTVLVGQISNNNDKWFKIWGEINRFFPSVQTDTYSISFNPENLLDFPVNQDDIVSLFDLLIQRLSLLKKDYNHSDLGEAIEEVRDAKANFLKKYFKHVRKRLLECHREIFSVRRKAPSIYKNELYDTLIQIENLYDRSLENVKPKPTHSSLQNKLRQLNKMYKSRENWLLQKKQKGADVTNQAVLLGLAGEKLTKASDSLNDQKLNLAEIILESTQRLLKEIR